MLGCGRHACAEVCHPEECPPCPKTSLQTCECGQQKKLRPCATPNWQCKQTVRKFQETQSIADRPRKGRPRKTTPGQDRYVRLSAHRNPIASATTLRHDLREATGVVVSSQTVRNRLHDIGLYARRPLKTPALRPHHKLVQGVMFGRHTPLVSIEGNMTAAVYENNILQPIVSGFAETVGEGFTLQDDNARSHHAHSVQRYLVEHGIRRMDWPACSPDMNCIEHAWSFLRRAISNRPHHPLTIQELRNAALEEWDNLPQESLDALVLNMPRRIQECLRCLAMVTKKCRCGLHSKELPCQKEFLCETKCKRMKECMRHPCNRKCCDGNCPPCEKPCGRTLRCGNHKCSSVCHLGPCYPCPLTAEVKCHCGLTVLTVPCGRKKQTRPPRCNKPCRIEPDCHHPNRERHNCHFGECPPCRQICAKALEPCKHSCPAPCHSAVWVKVEEDRKPVGPWDVVQPQLEMKALPCPNCQVPMPVTCLGGHETCNWPCCVAKPSSCQRECGRLLLCGNHTCTLACHTVEGAPDEVKAGKNCEQCESGCTKPRPVGCTHTCLKPCHPGDCLPCSQMLRVHCHCNLNQLYVRCSEWTSPDAEKKLTLQSCGNQCPKNFPCGHRCRATCHPGDCPDPDKCRKKVKLTCPCRRLKKEFPCDIVRANQTIVECDDVCKQKKEEEFMIKEQERLKKQLEEERRNQEEVEKFQKKFQARKKHRERRQHEEQETRSFLARYWMVFVGLSGIILASYFVLTS
ncbi:hypothetical protein ANN_20491 [Periplaneta americana]|uniref:NF-X1-type domain-containing protein n=1 Tax=Periplaneta americana TaxID=6978 RepID=A0ABQ8SDI8_PERAM|nr:hypothetical protein ANN_20491 [Periplaneta americana]